MENKKFNPQEHMMDLKGKQYLQVMWRLVWFREEHPDWRIQTEIIEHVYGDHAVIGATIMDPKTETIFSNAVGSESIKDFKDYLEKAETKAIGRALAILGYGTQFAPEMDEDERIVDSPVAKKTPVKKAPVKVEKPVATEPKAKCCACEAPLFKAEDGRKYNGKIYCNECIKKGIHKL